MGSVIHLRKQSPEPADVPRCPGQLDEVLTGLAAVVDGIVVVESKGEMMVRCITALQESLEAFEGIHGMVADSGDHEQFLHGTKLINSKLRSELTKLASIMLKTRLAAERLRQIDRSVR
jgi:hypothetical protein